jgi:hypothetical protein
MVEPPQVFVDPMPETLVSEKVKSKTIEEANAAKPEGEIEVTLKTGVVYVKEARKESVLMDAMKPAVTAPAAA